MTGVAEEQPFMESHQLIETNPDQASDPGCDWLRP